MGPWMCAALVVGNIIGTGIFMLPVALAPSGMNSVPAWFFTGIGALLLSFVFARLARDLPEAGGPFAYTRLAFGPFAAFIVAWGYWVSIWAGNATIATGTVAYLAELVPVLKTDPRLSAAAAIALIWLFTGVNLYGVRTMGSVQVATTVMKLLPLALIIALGALAVMRDPAPAQAAFAATEFGYGPVTAAATITLWSLLGFESATVPADKVENPRRNIPLATLYGCLACVLICMAGCTIVQILVPPEQLAASTAPFADAMRLLLGNQAALGLILFAVVSGAGCLNGWTLLQAEVPAAMAKSGVFPRVFARTSSRGVPAFALVATSLMPTVLVMANSSRSMANLYVFMLLLATSATLVMYLAVALAGIVLSGPAHPLAGSSRWLAPAGAAAALYSIWTVVGAGLEAFLWCLALLAAGVPVYLWQRARPGGGVQNVPPR